MQQSMKIGVFVCIHLQLPDPLCQPFLQRRVYPSLHQHSQTNGTDARTSVHDCLFVNHDIRRVRFRSRYPRCDGRGVGLEYNPTPQSAQTPVAFLARIELEIALPVIDSLIRRQ